MKRLTLLAWIGVLGLVGLSIFLTSGRQQGIERFDIAVVGPMSGDYAEYGIAMRRGAERAIAEINAQHTLGNIRLGLVAADDESDQQSRYRPQEVAKNLAKNPRLLAVVGHYFSIPSIAAAPHYAQHDIPVITPAATHPDVTHPDVKSGKTAIVSMMINDQQQGAFLAHYAMGALKRQRIAIVHVTSPHDDHIKSAFTKALTDKGVKPFASMSLAAQNLQPENLAPQLEKLREADLILLAMRHEPAAKVASYLRNKQVKAEFIGGEEIGSARFIKEAGFYAEQTYAIRPFLPDLLGQTARKFIQGYTDAHGQAPDWVAAQSYEAVTLIARGIEREGASRGLIKRFLEKLQQESKAVPGLSGNIYFDRHGINQRVVSIAKVVNGKHISAEHQPVSLKYPELARTRGDKTSEFNGQLLKQSTVMYTGMVVNEVSDLNVTGSGRFNADFTVWFRWSGREKAEIDFELANGSEKSRTIIEQHVDAKTSEHYRAYRIAAAFEQQFAMHDYPFDKQTLKIQIRPKQFATDDVLLVKDFSERNYLATTLPLGIWIDKGHQEYVDQDEFLYSLRNPQFDKKTYRLHHAVYNYDIAIERNVFQYMIKLMPLLIVMLAAYLTFHLDIATSLAPRLSICMTSLLSAVAFHISQNSNIANIGYLIKVDYFFMLTYWLIFFCMAEAIAAKSLHGSGKLPTAKKLDFYASWLYLIAILVSVIILVS